MIKYNEDAIQYLAKLGEGGLRTAITLLEKCLNYSEDLTIDNIVKALGIANYDSMFSLFSAICEKDTALVLEQIDNIYQSGADMKQFISEFTNMILDICKYKLSKSFSSVKIPNTYKDVMDKYTDSNEYAIAYALLDMLMKLNANMRWETNPKALFEANIIVFMGEI